jgi:hypothetical protein
MHHIDHACMSGWAAVRSSCARINEADNDSGYSYKLVSQTNAKSQRLHRQHVNLAASSKPGNCSSRPQPGDTIYIYAIWRLAVLTHLSTAGLHASSCLLKYVRPRTRVRKRSGCAWRLMRDALRTLLCQSTKSGFAPPDSVPVVLGRGTDD